MAQCLKLHVSTAGGMGLIPGEGTKILHATHCSQKKKKKKIKLKGGGATCQRKRWSKSPKELRCWDSDCLSSEGVISFVFSSVVCTQRGYEFQTCSSKGEKVT